jgi:hypothetical protein
MVTDPFIEVTIVQRHGFRQHIRSGMIRMANDLDTMELLVSDDVFFRATSLVDRLRRRTITRPRYETLVALITENALRTGQVEETQEVLGLLDRHWRRCPARYLPSLTLILRRVAAFRRS